MVNNHSKGAYYLRSFLLSLFLSAICNLINAQDISKYYTSSIQENGTLYFIQSKQEFKNKKERCKFSYDLTYLTTKDSISLKFTYYDTKIRSIDSISIVQGNTRISNKTEKLFIDTDKDLWKHRYSTKFLFYDLNSIFRQEKKITVFIYYDNKTVQLGLKNNKWKKQSEIISKILTLIEANIKSEQ